MAEFESRKLTVTLDDQASAGLANLRTAISSLTSTATQATASLAQVAQGVQQTGAAAGQAVPAVRQTDRALSDLGKSAGDTASGVMQMVMSMRGGVGSLPQLALGLRQASLGIQGIERGIVHALPRHARHCCWLRGSWASASLRLVQPSVPPPFRCSSFRSK